MKARVLKGGWSWLGELMVVGQIIDAPSEQWIANRIADNGLVEAVAETASVAASEKPAESPVAAEEPEASAPETATSDAPTETAAVTPRPRAHARNPKTR